MVIISKNNGQPHWTIDLQHLNAQCEIHHISSPFYLACLIPLKTKEKLPDAADGYHGIPLDKESQPFTTFIAEQGCHMYLQLPQGLLMLQGFIQAIFMSRRQHQKLNFLIEFSNSIFLKFYFKAYWH